MTVEELIEELQAMPRDATLVFDADDAVAWDSIRVRYISGEVVLHLEAMEDDDPDGQ